MKGYKTYKEAKEKHPDCEIVRPTQKNIDEFNEPDLFHPVIENCLYSDGYEYLLKKDNGPRISDGYWCVVGESKPRTKTEFVEFEKLSDLVLTYESGEVFYCEDSAGNKNELSVYGAIAMHRHSDSIYRKVETEINERQGFIDKCVSSIKSENSCDPMHYNDWFGQMYDSGKFKLVE